jgi:hypothetical protein
MDFDQLFLSRVSSSYEEKSNIGSLPTSSGARVTFLRHLIIACKIG